MIPHVMILVRPRRSPNVFTHLRAHKDHYGRYHLRPLVQGSGLIPSPHLTDKDSSMTRDAGLEQMVSGDLAGLTDITTTTMFGGFAWMWQGHLLCCARHDGILFRLGKGNDAWALALPDVAAMVMGGRPMQGWVRATGDAMADDALRHRLIAAAQAFVTTLPAK
jgi:TfoX N-terminal domain